MSSPLKLPAAAKAKADDLLAGKMPPVESPSDDDRTLAGHLRKTFAARTKRKT